MIDLERQHARRASVFALGTLLSRVLGLVRDVVWFKLIPTSSLGAFLVAWKFPNMLRDLVGEGASNAAFIPVFSASLEKDDEAAFRELVSAVMLAMLIVLACLAALGAALVPLILEGSHVLRPLTGRGPLEAETVSQTVLLARWIFPYIFFVGMAVFAMGALFSAGRYATASWSPALLNVAIVASCLLFHKRFSDPAYALVVGVWAGGIAQLTANYVALGCRVGVWRPNFKLNHPAIRAIFALMVPVLLGQATAEVNKLVDALFAFRLGPAVVKALYSANRLVQLPLSMFALAVAAAILPSVSRAGARGDNDAIRTTLMQGLRQSFFLVFPAMLGLIVLREPIVRLLFERGEFSRADTARAAAALAIYGAGLLSFAWVKVAVSGFYAVRNTRTPVIIASASMVLNILLNCALVRPLGYAGLALATTVSFTINFILLYVFLSNRFGWLCDRSFMRGLLRMTLAAVIMAAVAFGIHFRLSRTFDGETLAAKAALAGIPVVAAAVVYAVLCAGLGVGELRSYWGALKKRRE